MYRKGISALIINKDKDFLLVNLKSFEDKYFAIPGGGVEEGETLEEATYREIEEELGITAKSLELVGKGDSPLRFKFKVIKMTREGVEYEGSERNFFGFNFIGKDDEIKLQESEVKAYRWVPFTELKNYLLFDNQLEETTEKILEVFPSFQTK
ncbi:MAG: NUDIX domain-containing protein [bacterium]